MAGYIIGQLKDITDAEAFSAYQAGAGPALAKYGGKLLVNSTKIDSGDGDWSPEGIVVVEFESLEQAKKFYNSPEYQGVIGQRFSSADSAVIFADGD
jgi:uncharacterized protein (DUF1330 family)